MHRTHSHCAVFPTRRSLRLILALAGLLWLFPLSARADGTVPNHIIVQLNKGVSISTITQAYGTTATDHVPGNPIYSLAVPSGSTPDAFAARLSGDNRLSYAETDTYLDNPEVLGEPIHLAFDAGPDPGDYVNSMAYTQVDLGNAWSRSTGAGVIVAVLDTGATFTHPALQGHYIQGYNAIKPGTRPLDIADGVTNAAVGHGTMVAGLIAYLAPGAKIMPVRVLNGDGIGTVMQLAKGIHYAITHGARVLNMSLGTHQTTNCLNEVLDEASNAGAILVSSAGNDDQNIAQFPAARHNVIGVTSVEQDDTKSSYSNYGSTVIVVSPGSGIRSTYYTGGYADWSGTSFAAPFVSGEAALLLAMPTTMNLGNIIQLISSTAQSVDNDNPDYHGQLGKGIIDIQTAVMSAH